MNKLNKHIFVILLISAFSCTAFAQRGRMRMQGQGGHMRMQDQGNRAHMGEQRFARPEYFDHPQNLYRNPGNKVYRMPNPNGVKRIQVVKENFLGRQLSLTPEQSEKFWPVYRQYQNELSNVRRLKRLNYSDPQGDGSEQIRKDLEYDSQLDNIKKHYTDEFLKIVPPEKVSQLYKSERAFTDEMMKQLNERNAAPQ